MKCRRKLKAKVIIVDPGGTCHKLNAKVYYHEARKCKAKYNHIDIFIPKSQEYTDILQKGYYNALINKNKLLLDLSALVKGYKLVVELSGESFTKDAKYVSKVYRYAIKEYIKVTIRLPKYSLINQE